MGASALVMALSLNSCSSDDNGGGVSAAKLEGKWEFSKEKFSAAGQALPEEDYEGNQAGCSKDYITMSETGTYVWGDYWDSECSLDLTEGTWSLDGKTLTMTDEFGTDEMTVVSVSSTKLVVKSVTTEGGIEWTERYTLTKAAQ